MLTALGISPCVETVYRYLLKDPSYDIEDLATTLNWTGEEVREALDRLADLHLVGPGPEESTTVPAHPASALSFLMARAESELHRRKRDLELARHTVASLASDFSGEGAPPMPGYETVARLPGPEVMRVRMAELADSAVSECLCLQPEGPQQPDALGAAGPLERAALERGVALRTLRRESFRGDPAALRRIRALAERGGQTRTVPVVPLQMVIVDRRTALVPIDPESSGAGALEVRSPGLVTALCLLFESYWRQGVPIGGEQPSDVRGLTLRDQEVLRLLASGCTDEHVARKLGVSLRTVRRINSQLAERLGARSRFEAGVLSAQRGWL